MNSVARSIMAALVVFAATSCCCYRQCPYRNMMVSDTTYREVRDTLIVRDTIVMAAVPADSAAASLPLGCDTLKAETSLAIAFAWIEDGRQNLSLRNKAGAIIPATVQIQDRAHYEMQGLVRTITKTVEVEKDLTAWQNLRLALGTGALCILVALAFAAIIWLIIKIIK